MAAAPLGAPAALVVVPAANAGPFAPHQQPVAAGGGHGPPPPDAAGGHGNLAPDPNLLGQGAGGPGLAQQLAGGPGGMIPQQLLPPLPNGGAGGAVLVGGNVGPSWDALVAAADFKPYEVGFALNRAYLHVTWLEAMAPFLEAAARADGVNLNNLVAEYSLTPATRYFLVVFGGRVEVMYGLRGCTQLAGNGGRYLTLVGERTMVAGHEAQPKLYKLDGALGVQFAGFERQDAEPPELAAIAAAFAADPALTLVDPLPPNPDDPPETVTAWKVLPIHPKLASLFLRGMLIRDAVTLVTDLMAAAPPDRHPDLAQLVAFVRVASTQDNAAESMLAGRWMVQHHAQTAGLEEWYYQLLSASAPRWAPPEPLPPSAAEQPGQPTNATAAASIAQALQDLVDKGTEKAPQTKDYERFELERIFQATGVPAPWEGLGEEVIPPAFVVLKANRAKATKARVVLEDYFRKHYPRNRDTYPFLWTTELVESMRQLDFAGEDPLITWTDRHLGVSLFSLAPLESYYEGRGVKRNMISYENTIANHAPSDTRAMLDQSAFMGKFPIGRDSLRKWLDHFDIWITSFFGINCGLLAPIRGIREKLKLTSYFATYTDEDWICFVWIIHIGVRRFFMEDETIFLERIVADLSSGIRTGPNILPPEIRQRSAAAGGALTAATVTSDDSSFGSSGSSVGSYGSDISSVTIPGMPPTKRQKPDRPPRPPPMDVAWTSAFAPDIQRAQLAVKPLTLTATKLCPTANISAFLGREFLSLVPMGKSPCLHYFIFGKCSFQKCSNTHNLTKPPSPAVVAGIAGRVKARVDAIVANPKA